MTNTNNASVEKMSDDQIIEEERVLNAEIEALRERLNKIETEIFYRRNPECRIKNKVL